MEYLLNTNCLTKQFKNCKAVNNVSMSIKQGEIYGFIGRNGAGKTTFLKMISGLTYPTSGEISLFGYSGSDMKKMYSRIGTLIEDPGLYPNLCAYDNLKLKCLCVGINKPDYISNLLKTVGLLDVGKKSIRNYSLGMKQRLGIAMALVGEPDLLVLDEPTNGLDPQGIAEVRDTIIKLNKEKNITIIVSSHILEELSKIATNYGIIHNGTLIEQMTREELLARCCERIEIKLEQPELACTILDKMNFMDYKVVEKNKIHVFERLEEISDIAMELVNQGIKIQSITVASEALEEFFFELTGGNKDA